MYLKEAFRYQNYLNEVPVLTDFGRLYNKIHLKWM